MTTKPKFAFALDYVKDVEVSKQFYVGVLGLEPDRSHPTFAQFGSFAVASDESLGGKGESELYWAVDDAESAFRELSKKAEVALPLTEKPFGKVFAIRDPDGRPRYVIQFARNRPSMAHAE